MKIEGKHRYNSSFGPCGHAYELVAIVPQPLDARMFDMETIDKPVGRIIEKKDNNYFVKVICPKCYQDNTIEHEN
ncbi:hypothetical protein [Paenibacillus hexagrammi]|uniref:Uncharacterized protein n=1 Tax=Paenibacillus hexagrammi TaxID=2908839 RepID=A0ABY3SKQ9_9BACL|nr:hypothetical protein [Paenibacillus sp. YPD9-1]UJF33730.1 hypothetical protein L0M14_00220 [Paenibacillus sp. YPD9-1]